ncbi:Tn3 family transposase [Candidatus Wolfebacteria bacterium]|nr:MAG: Tn3 family transposase [Candidatus Wolfebacteria bacterium]
MDVYIWSTFMTSISRTAYPRLRSNQVVSPRELSNWYSPTQVEVDFTRHNIRGDNLKLGYLVQLKVCQKLGYFCSIDETPADIINYIQEIMFVPGKIITTPLYGHNSAMYRHRDKIREQLSLKRWGKFKSGGLIKNWGLEHATNVAKQQAHIKNSPADIINAVIEKLREDNFELPAFDELDELVGNVRANINDNIFFNIRAGLDQKIIERLKSLLVKKKGSATTNYQRLKEKAKSTTITHFRETIKHYQWITALGDFSELLVNVSKVKIEQFAEEARSLDAYDLKDHNEDKQLALIVCLVYSAKLKTMDDLAQMYCVTMSKIHKKAKVKLAGIMESSQQLVHDCLNLLSGITQHIENNPSPDCYKSVAGIIMNYGGIEKVRSDCDQAIANTSNDHIPLLWEFYKNNRSTVISLLQILNIQSATQNDSLIKAMQVVIKNSTHDTGTIATDGDLSFVPDKWTKLISNDKSESGLVNHRYYELCVLSCLADELRSGDVYINNADSYGDYRNNLLNWQDCSKQVGDYTKDIGLPDSPDALIQHLKYSLRTKASLLDKMFPDIAELEIDDKGRPTLKKCKPNNKPASAIRLANEIRSRMPERNIMDILSNCHHYTDWASVFSPISGSDPKLKNAIEKYILTTFTYGTCMGPAEAARHIKADISEKTLSKINHRHVLPKTQDIAIARIINQYIQFGIIKAWGDGKSVAADGTMESLREDSLIAEFHIRYHQKGGIAYHHISNNYIAIFSTFIPCGVWEAVHILEGLLKNKSDLTPDVIHADTQGQSTVVFALSYLLGIKLMPRIRNWKDLTMYKYDSRVKYKNIDPLFSGKIKWELIRTHWKDMMQAVLSVKNGVISSPLLLRKLTNYSRKNRLFKALRELGKVMRTLYLLDYISDVTLREKVTETTNKVESYNNLSDWASFGAKHLVASNDPDEMEKAVKYNDLVTNSVMLQNVIDMTNIINELKNEGMEISINDISYLSPYITEHIKRFGDYIIDLSNIPRRIPSYEMDIAWAA